MIPVFFGILGFFYPLEFPVIFIKKYIFILISTNNFLTRDRESLYELIFSLFIRRS